MEKPILYCIKGSPNPQRRMEIKKWWCKFYNLACSPYSFDVCSEYYYRVNSISFLEAKNRLIEKCHKKYNLIFIEETDPLPSLETVSFTNFYPIH